MIHTPAERQYLARHQSDVDALLADLSERDLLRDSVREEWRHAIQSAIIIRNQVKGMAAFRSDGLYKGALVSIEQALRRFVRAGGHDGVEFDHGGTAGYQAVIDLQEAVGRQIEDLIREDPSLAARHSMLAGEIRANRQRTREAHSL